MSTTTTLTPREKQARRYATTLALIATLGPFFYGFEGMVLNAAIKAVGSTFELGPILQGVAGAAEHRGDGLHGVEPAEEIVLAEPQQESRRGQHRDGQHEAAAEFLETAQIEPSC